jgi:hypothetical protein
MTTSTPIKLYLEQQNSVKIETKNGTGDLFTFYQNQEDGSLQLLVKKSQLNKEYIYFSQIADGLNELGVGRGDYNDSYIFYIKKYFDKLQFIKPNTSFYFDKNSNLSKSSDANISDAVLASVKILADDETVGEYLIDFNGLILSETFTGIGVGTLSSNGSTIESIQSFPKNTNIKTKYVYLNSNNQDFSIAGADPRVFSIKVFHTFMDVPDNDYEPRINDRRVGYFVTQTNDMITTKNVNYRDFIHRWRLIKKEKNAAISEPETPITWWLENSTPLQWRDTIKEGVLAWNVAFEKAGFKNVMVVKEQPDDAEWDAGDIQYNVLRWASSLTSQHSGFGPSVVNPKTGEIMGADIMLEFKDMFFATQQEDELYDKENVSHKSCKCSAMKHANEGLQFGRTVLDVTGASQYEYELTRLQKEYMKMVVMHEIGHTLGLRHNMKASQLFTPEQLADKVFIEGKGKSLSGSIMDYMTINLTNDRSKQGQYYSTNIGPYDIWAIQFGYTPFNNESERLALLNKSTLPELAYGTDEDDMRDPGKAIDPRVMLHDLSSDAITYSVNRIKLVNKLMKNIKNKFMINGEWYQGLVNAYNALIKQKSQAGEVISRYVGGVYVERATIGQEGATKPFTPVPLKEQKRAMRALNKYIFSPKAIEIKNNFYNYFAKEMRDYDEKSEDPKIHSMFLNYQMGILKHLVHPNTLQRMLDSELYGNQYNLVTFMNDLNDIIFKDDINKNINSFRRNLQLYYVKMFLIPMVTEKSQLSSTSQSIAYYNLNKIKFWINKYKDSGDLASRAHKKYLKTLISNALKKI